jgi:NAD(P)-dependent dehydrogenase (short-subunit alcohol dehydrogenase family)
MPDNAYKTAIVTGATSGLGLEAAAQLSEAGYARVTVTGRTEESAGSAREQLIARTGRDIFETLALDLDKPKSVGEASRELVRRGQKVDFLLLNAGMVSGSELVKTDEGIEITSASSLIGHHQLTMQLIEDDLFSDRAHIVIAGSEAARGDVPTFKPVDLSEFADEKYSGDMAVAAEALLRYDPPLKYKPTTAYSNAKLFVAYWSAELARRLPTGMTVNAVSPGSAPDTDASRNSNFFMKRILLPFFKVMPGRAATIPVAAGRYIEASDYPEQVTGQFFASAPKKLTGDLHKVDLPHVTDRRSQAAAWDAIVEVAGGVDYPVAAATQSKGPRSGVASASG